jgi:predicted nucleic acid-binding protein
MYLLDTSGLVRLLSDVKLQEAWYDAVDAEAIGSCYPQRTEFLYTARNASEYEEITEMFGDLYPDVSVPKNAGRWIASVQRYLAQAGAHRSASAVDLMIAATAAITASPSSMTTPTFAQSRGTPQISGNTTSATSAEAQLARAC